MTPPKCEEKALIPLKILDMVCPPLKNSEYGQYPPKIEGPPPVDVFDTFPNFNLFDTGYINVAGEAIKKEVEIPPTSWSSRDKMVEGSHGLHVLFFESTQMTAFQIKWQLPVLLLKFPLYFDSQEKTSKNVQFELVIC